MGWKKLDNDTFIREGTYIIEKVKLSELKKLVKEFQSMEKPSIEELVELGKTMHPYYLRLSEILRLKKIITQLEVL